MAELRECSGYFSPDSHLTNFYGRNKYIKRRIILGADSKVLDDLESKCSAGLVNRQGVLSHNSREGYTAFLDNYQVALQKLFLFVKTLV